MSHLGNYNTLPETFPSGLNFAKYPVYLNGMTTSYSLSMAKDFHSVRR
jgi:hypothetical protein